MNDVRQTLAARGYAVVAADDLPPEVGRDPWRLIERLVGERPALVEEQPIRPVAGGRSFASTRVFTPLHTDSQSACGVPPSLQMMRCERAAPRGGETLLLDAWQLLEHAEHADPDLMEVLFTERRTIPFYFGAVTTATVAFHGDALVFTHSPMPPRDAIGERLSRLLTAVPTVEIALKTGEILLVDNHRMLHGRRAFEGERLFSRVLAWTSAFAAPERWRTKARAAGQVESAAPLAQHRLRVVLELLSGVPPAKLAAREGVPEAEIYAWRTRALAAAATAIAD